MKRFFFILIATVFHYYVSGQNKPEGGKAVIGLPEFGEPNKIKKDTFSYFSITDTNLAKYSLPKKFKKPKNWRLADKRRSRDSTIGYILQARIKDDTLNLKKAITIIDNEKDYGTLCYAKTWCVKNYSLVFPYLISRLTIKQKTGLRNSMDLIIWDRIESGDLQFYGHGGSIAEDIFTISGRASWILNEITGEEFAVVHGSTTEAEAKKFKALWLDYIKKL